MKVRLTHTQLYSLEDRLIRETEGPVEDRTENDLSYIEEKCNNIYRTVMSSTVMEVIDGDVDVDQHLSIIKHLENMIDRIYSNEGAPEINNELDTEEIREKDGRLLDRYNKIKILKNVLEQLKGLSDLNNDKKVNKVYKHKTAKIRS